MKWQEVILLSTLLVSTEQKPSIYFESETDLLEEIRGIRNTDNADILISSKIQRFYETAPVPADAIIENEEVSGNPTIEMSTESDEISRHIREIETMTEKQETSTVASDKIQENIDEMETTTVSEEMTTSNEGITDVPIDKIDVFAVFLKFASKNFEDDTRIEKRSVKGIGLEDIEREEEQIEGDLDTAANTVFRPLFAYRQQEARRRRYRQNIE